MCIRDSPVAASPTPEKLERSPSDSALAPRIGALAVLIAVSYTHLDVYKRQFRQRMNLIDNLTGSQVGLITLLSGHAELAVHLAAYL